MERVRGMWRLWAAAMLMLVAAAASASSIDAIVVKFRGDEALAGVQALPSGHRFVVTRAMQADVTELGRTVDGAFRLALEPALPFAEAHAAINRLRLEQAVLYVNFSSRESLAQRVRPKATPGTRDAMPLQQLIVKFRDPALQARAAAQLALPQDKLDRIAALAGVAAGHQRIMFNGAYVVRLFSRLSRDKVEEIADALAQDADVEYAEPDYRAFIAAAPNDPMYVSQWHYSDPVGGVNLPNAWNRTTGSASIRVAVIDTGYTPHPDLVSRIVGGHDFVFEWITSNDGSPVQPAGCTPTVDPRFGPCINDRDTNPSDPGDWITAADDAGSTFGGWLQFCGASNSSWHGTHVAGTIGAVTNNGVGVAGVNWTSPIVAARVLGRCGGYSSDIADAIVWSAGGAVAGVPANANPARVLNLSIGGGNPCGATYQNAINTALSLNAVIAIAAGNENTDASQSSPGNCNGVITVAATGRLGQRASYSNFDDNRFLNPANTIVVEIAAPGGSDGQTVLSTLNSGTTSPVSANYVGYNGTSMATPHVAGIASLMLSVNPTLTPAQVLSFIQSTARAFPSGTGRDCTSNFAAVDLAPNFPKYCGAGIIDADAAIAAVSPGSTTSIASSLNPSVFGQNVTFTATVTGNAPTGSVSFTANSVVIPGCGTVALTGAGNARTAQCATPNLSVATHSMGASYSGDGNNAPSVATPLAQVVNAPPLAAIKQRDFNNDSKGDILWRSALGSGHAIWLMNASSVLQSANIGAPADWLVTHTADFNNDNRHDLILRSQSTGATAMWLMNGVAFTSVATLLSDPNWSVVHTGDFNGDGNKDLVWHHAPSGTTSIWLMNGTTLLSGATMLVAPGWNVTHVADFNADGKDDLLWRNATTGDTAMWLLNGTSFLGGSIILSSTAWSPILTGDLSGDGKADIVWRNAATGQTAVWVMNGNAMTTGAIVLTDVNWAPTHVADFDGNGKQDLVWRNSATGATSIWLMNGAAMASGGSVTIAGSSVVATGDYNADGRADLVWHNTGTGLTQMRLMTGLTMGASLPLINSTDWQVRP